MACSGTYCSGNCYSYGCGSGHKGGCGSNTNGRNNSYNIVWSGSYLSSGVYITNEFANALRDLIDGECGRRGIGGTGLGNLGDGATITGGFFTTLKNKINSFYGSVGVNYVNTNTIDPSDFTGLRERITTAMHDCVCNSNCGANARCGCHNDCGCHY